MPSKETKKHQSKTFKKFDKRTALTYFGSKLRETESFPGGH